MSSQLSMIPPGTPWMNHSPLAMARVDSLLWFMLGIGQLLIGSQLGSSGALLELLSILLNVSGGASNVGIYFLIFLARHEKEFSEVYSKMEKTEFIRDETGRIIDVADKTQGQLGHFGTQFRH